VGVNGKDAWFTGPILSQWELRYGLITIKRLPNQIRYPPDFSSSFIHKHRLCILYLVFGAKTDIKGAEEVTIEEVGGT
jgi:hypothetical protein